MTERRAVGDVPRVMMDGSRTVVLVKRGRIYAQAVVLDVSVHVRDYPVRAWWKPEEHGLRPMLLEGQPYPVDFGALRLIEAGATLGITEGAKRALLRLLPVPRNLDETEQATPSQPNAAP